MENKTGKVIAISTKFEGRYGFHLGEQDNGQTIWYNGEGKCPIGKGDNIEFTYVASPNGNIIQEIKVKEKAQAQSQGNPNTTMYVSYAKDIFIATTEKQTNLNYPQAMKTAIDLVKQAREEFS